MWCPDLDLLDKLAGQNNGVYYSLVVVDIFLRCVRVQTLKRNIAKDTLQAFIKIISRKNSHVLS